MTAANIETILDTYRKRIEIKLKQLLPDITTPPQRLHQAMHYSVFNGGKRLRPCLVYLTGTALACPLEQLDIPAVAVELVHCYSLVHDDLPAMDDDDLRRGKPTCHKRFGDAIAILVGDALQGLAFELLSANDGYQAQQQLAMIRCLAKAINSQGMVGGQALDILAEQSPPTDQAALQHIHQLKTGALLQACVQLALCLANHATTGLYDNLNTFASKLGLAYQIQDDLLDQISTSQTLGKPQGSDQKRGLTTYANLMTKSEIQGQIALLHQQAASALNGLGQQAEPLLLFLDYLTRRDH